MVKVPISVIILDENDNQPMFRGLPYKVRVHHMFSRILNFIFVIEFEFHQFKEMPSVFMCLIEKVILAHFLIVIENFFLIITPQKVNKQNLGCLS